MTFCHPAFDICDYDSLYLFITKFYLRYKKVKVQYNKQHTKQANNKTDSQMCTFKVNIEPTIKCNCKTSHQNLKGDVGRMTESADFICRQNRQTIICRVSCKNCPILSAKIEHVLSSTILSANFFYIGQQILFMLPW